MEAAKLHSQMKPNLPLPPKNPELRPRSNSKTVKLEMPVVEKESDHLKYASDLRK